MSTRHRINTLVFALAAIHSANAELVVADFNDNILAPLGSFTTGAGQGGGSGFLEGDVWANTGVISVIDGDLSVPAGTNFVFTQGELEGAHSIQNLTTNTRQTTRALATAMGTTSDIWFSFLLNQPSINSRGGITFNQPASLASPGNPRVVATGTDLRIGLGPTLQATGVNISLATDTLIVGQLIIDPAGAETINLWVNPDVSGGIGGLGAPHNTLSEDAPVLDAGVTRAGLQTYSSDSLGGIVDAFRMSDEINAFELVTTDAVVIVDDPNLIVSNNNPFSASVINADTAAIIADITINNGGTANSLTISDTSAISGANSADFSIITALPLEILPGQSEVLQVMFVPPGTLGTYTGSLDIASNDTSTAVVSIPLSAQVMPLLQVAPTNPFAGIEFPINPLPAIVDITLSNVGSSTTLTIADTTAITGDAAFSIVSALPFDILPGQSTTLQVRFDGASGGSFVGQLGIVSNDPGNGVVTIPLAASVPLVGVNILANGDFEADNASLPDWQLNLTGTGASAVTGIVPGSNTAAFVAAGGALFQTGLVTGEDWYADFYFQTDTNTPRPFNVLIGRGTQRMNLRYDGTAWATFDNTNFNDDWGTPLGLGSITSNGVYFMRIVGKGWGTASPTYDVLLSEAGSNILTRQQRGIDRYQDGTPAGPPAFIRFSQEFGGGTGFTVDQVNFVNGPAPKLYELKITNFEFDDIANTATVTWDAEPGTDYVIEASDNLKAWTGAGNRLATGESETFTEFNVTVPIRFYRILKD